MTMMVLYSQQMKLGCLLEWEIGIFALEMS